jgi:hypothetical protein
MVREGYHELPYHNWSHAFADAHFADLLSRFDSLRAKLSPLTSEFCRRDSGAAWVCLFVYFVNL